MCGIFAYLNYNVSRERRYILEVLFNGLRRLEYRGYDSSGIALDADRTAPSSSASPSDAPYTGAPPLVFREEGKIENLVRSVYSGQFSFDLCFCPSQPSVPECFLVQSGFLAASRGKSFDFDRVSGHNSREISLLGVVILDNSAFLTSHVDIGIAYFQKFRISFLHISNFTWPYVTKKRGKLDPFGSSLFLSLCHLSNFNMLCNSALQHPFIFDFHATP
jgi:hypothetical protein